MLTPLDIENKRFTRTLKGYNVEEVDDFLDELTIEYEKLYRENAEMKSSLETMEKNIEHYKNVENTLQNTLIMAQSAAEDIKAMAQKQAEQIVKDAQFEVSKSIEGLKTQEFETRLKTEELKKQFNVYRAKMEAILISQLELLQDKDEESNI